MTSKLTSQQDFYARTKEAKIEQLIDKIEDAFVENKCEIAEDKHGNKHVRIVLQGEEEKDIRDAVCALYKDSKWHDVQSHTATELQENQRGLQRFEFYFDPVNPQ